jgi:hypothetical protein
MHLRSPWARDAATLIAVEQEEIWGFATTGPSQDTDLPNLRELWAIYVDPQQGARASVVY